jgi:hypothetical protein
MVSPDVWDVPHFRETHCYRPNDLSEFSKSYKLKTIYLSEFSKSPESSRTLSLSFGRHVKNAVPGRMQGSRAIREDE